MKLKWDGEGRQNNRSRKIGHRSKRTLKACIMLRAILEDIPLGNRRLETGLLLRDAWFINGTMYNIEVWGSFTKTDLKCLEILDRQIFKLIFGAQYKS